MTTIGPSVTFSGELISTEDLTINGHITGHVLVRDAALIIGDEGRVKADVRGARVVVRGQVDGSIVASERIELAPSARVDGSLSANRIVIVDGAQFTGQIDMDQRTIAAKLAQYRAAQETAVTR
jgi:cytoskeletal protein CcmA (bactofilin family)